MQLSTYMCPWYKAVANSDQMILLKAELWTYFFIYLDMFPHFLMYSNNYFGPLTILIAAHFRYTDTHKQGLITA